jgi:hypothetical protein
MEVAVRLIHPIPLLVVALSCVSAVSAGEFWTEKDYRQWSEKECKKMLQDSPWAKQYVISQVFITSLDAPLPSQREAATREREANARIVYQVQFRSALPTRQALVQLQNLRLDYDQLPGEQKQSVDQQAEEFLTAEFPDSLVVYVEYGSNVDFDNRELRRHWQAQTTETLKNTVFLIGSKGVRVTLMEYMAGKGARQVFQLTFPRAVDGKPVVGSKDKRIQLEFLHPAFRGQPEQRVLVDFKIKKMLMGADLIY